MKVIGSYYGFRVVYSLEVLSIKSGEIAEHGSICEADVSSHEESNNSVNEDIIVYLYPTNLIKN